MFFKEIAIVAAIALAVSGYWTSAKLKDREPPQVVMTSPTANATVSGIITIVANPTDNVGIDTVQMLIDGVNVGPQLTAPPYEVLWDTSRVFDGLHSVSAYVTDTRGNFAQAPFVMVRASNNKPFVSTPPANLRLWTLGREQDPSPLAVVLGTYEDPPVDVCCVRFGIYKDASKQVPVNQDTDRHFFLDGDAMPGTRTYYVYAKYGGSQSSTFSQPATKTITIDHGTPLDVVEVGSTIYISGSTTVHSKPSTASNTVIGSQENSIGTVIGGPETVRRKTMWQVDFETGADGWIQDTLGLYAIFEIN